MSEHALPVRAQLDAWRERGADRLDPLRFRLIEALAQRADGRSGEARRLLDARLSELIAQYTALTGGFAQATQDAHEAYEAYDAPDAPAQTSNALGALVDRLAHHANTENGAKVRNSDGSTWTVSPELIDYFRATWARVRAGQQLREAQFQVPQNAGPLNSMSLVHRSLSLMRELSPGYLQNFLAYADALSWLEQLNAVDAPASKEAPRAASTKKSTRSKAR
ncbi:DUF2894 domain-containing protein [Paraburkholderia ferrariae]|uniref:DUF2894 domain-containing protein n=1 Tax=Paraburkholderia ferrariae TaxID=386056 RepID=UPI000480E496|nr:DUF2894 domain-containing protein [Paraburkholderia ferrariae]